MNRVTTSRSQPGAHRQTGTVKFFDRRKGWGFIDRDEGGRQAFVHYKHIDAEGYRNLWEGERVSFDVIDVGRGPQAREVRVIRH